MKISLDKTPLDYFLRDYLKSKVYVNRTNKIESLKIRGGTDVMTVQIIQDVVDTFQFEHLFLKFLISYQNMSSDILPQII